ncbi:Putative glycine--tRNA ligase [Cladobotryum mycophilum]|uniref:Glycine--tRNA ligase n=1 Tax=Cladobotryum mycophilum TaxID=491253 RepID=A0ABR0S6I9_9HYPO
MELDCTVITPEPILKTSGHVDRFADWMCKDLAKGEYLRTDHLVEAVLNYRLKAHQSPEVDSKQKSPKLDEATVQEYEEVLAKIDNYDGPELGELIKKYDIRNPDGNGEVLPPIPFNLMFKSTIGPSSSSPVFLRPETTQGQFLNFKRLFEFGQNLMPFASASIGKSYRNEISPRSGLLRMSVELSQSICSIKKVNQIEHTCEYTPNVIEPSFGISRIRYSVLEHVYWNRPQDRSRGVLSLPIVVAPRKVLIVPLSNNPSFQSVVKKLANRLRTLRISNNVDPSSASIGKRYARNDELGTPLGITVDFDTVKDGSITLRERDSTLQVRFTEEEIVQAVRNLVDGIETWEQVFKRLPEFTGQSQEA